ncbi:hypothetical protein CEXT_154691 [Caerostris extrusa]|uniref:Uncharacterized protein n=1 Tax=Caerostris extrusa TaxID=172846 RepID=A0AAV4THP9_CAEEX|nr:hypothetical protein CEXT_154691 [Caerostris extrusa]
MPVHRHGDGLADGIEARPMFKHAIQMWLTVPQAYSKMHRTVEAYITTGRVEKNSVLKALISYAVSFYHFASRIDTVVVFVKYGESSNLGTKSTDDPHHNNSSITKFWQSSRLLRKELIAVGVRHSHAAPLK